MDIRKKQYKVVFTKECRNEMDYIYNYISQKLYASNSAKKLMNDVESIIKDLKYMPKAYRVIKKHNELQMEYRRIIVKNYVLIYTISEAENTVYIAHMYYGGSNYFNKI